MKTSLGLGGIWSRIVGIRATKAIIKAAIDAILSARLSSWKNMPMFMMARSHRGRKMVARATRGNLYRGTTKCAY